MWRECSSRRDRPSWRRQLQRGLETCDADRAGARRIVGNHSTRAMIAMTIHPLAGKPAPDDLLIDAGRLQREYYARKPDFTDRAQRVGFGTSGHRGSSLRGSFNETHVLAITQAICDYRASQGTGGPL